MKEQLRRIARALRPPSATELASTTPPIEYVASTKRMLFLEDSLEFVATMRQHTSKFDVDVDHCETVRAAWEALATAAQPYNCMILDVRLANGSGIDFYRTVATKWPATSVVFLTAYHNEELIRKVEAIGPARVYSKLRATDPDFLLSMLSQLGLTRLEQ
jgi:DNA-binding NarL/FixJ family response regulator